MKELNQKGILACTWIQCLLICDMCLNLIHPIIKTHLIYLLLKRLTNYKFVVSTTVFSGQDNYALEKQ